MKRLAAVLAIIGLVLLGYCVLVYLRAASYQTHEQRLLGEDMKPQAESMDGSAPPPPRVGSGAIALLTIPRIGLSTAVLEGAGARELKLGPGHIPGTPLPGEGGNFAVAGHRDTFFRPLRLIRPDDAIQVRIAGREFLYRVISMRIVSPHELEVLRPTGRESLTLVTCYPFDFMGPAPKRLIVRADCNNCPDPGRRAAALTSPRVVSW